MAAKFQQETAKHGSAIAAPPSPQSGQTPAADTCSTGEGAVAIDMVDASACPAKLKPRATRSTSARNRVGADPIMPVI